MELRTTLSSARPFRRLGLIVVALTIAGTPLAAVAEPNPTLDPDQPTMALVDAMEFAVASDPAIRLAEQASHASIGAIDQNRGAFDLNLSAQLSYDGAREYLTDAQLEGERQKRDLFRQLAVNLQRVADDLQDQLGGTGFVWADCPQGLDITIGDTPICISGRTQAIFDLYEDMANATNNQDAAAALVEANRRVAGNTVDILNINAYAQRSNLRNIGTVPSINGSLTTALDLRLTKLFRSGIVLEPGLILDGFQDNYIGKPANPAFGGKGLPDNVRSILGVTLDIPLGKGRGKVSTAAAERAAIASADAALADEAFAITTSVESTALAYWNLAAAQAILALQQETEAIQANLLDIGETLVAADEYAEADLHFLAGRLELTRGRVSAARESVLRARVDLARVMGRELTTVDEAPLAADELPRVPGDDERLPTIDEMVDAALQSRFDIAALRSRRTSAEFLARGARFDLKRRVDLQLAVGYAGLYEGGDISRPDDLARGWWEAVSDFSAGPSYRLGLRFELPFGNRLARGLSVQAHALDQQSRIELRDRERTVTNRIEQLSEALVRAIEEGHRREESVEHYRTTLGSDIEIFRAGEGSSIDVILTQESLVNEEIQLISARAAIAALATQLTFETGRLVDCRVADRQVTVMSLNPPGRLAALLGPPTAGDGGNVDGSD